MHVVRSANVRYSKVRPLHPLCQFDVCRHEVRYGCQREDSCSFAHSVIELKCWVLQQDTGGWSIFPISSLSLSLGGGAIFTELICRVFFFFPRPGITHEEMVQESKRHWQRLEQNAQKQQKVRFDLSAVDVHQFVKYKSCRTQTPPKLLCHLLQPIHIPHPSGSIPAGVGGMGGGGVGGECIGSGGVSPVGGLGAMAGRGRPLNLKMKFVCGQCWREGQVNEPDKNLKYCTAKARHR